MKTAKELLYEKCEKKCGCFLSGQVGWIVEVMVEYAQLKKEELEVIMWEYGNDCACTGQNGGELTKPEEWLKSYFNRQIEIDENF